MINLLIIRFCLNFIYCTEISFFIICISCFCDESLVVLSTLTLFLLHDHCAVLWLSPGLVTTHINSTLFYVESSFLMSNFVKCVAFQDVINLYNDVDENMRVEKTKFQNIRSSLLCKDHCVFLSALAIPSVCKTAFSVYWYLF